MSRGPEGGVDGEDLGVADVGDGPGLGDRLAGDRARSRRCPSPTAAGRRRGTGPWPTRAGRPVVPSRASIAAPRPQPPNRNMLPGAQPGHDRQVPAVRVVGRLEAEELPGVHRQESTGAGPLPSHPMPDTPWTGDACSLVDAFRSGERSPAEELDASLAAIEASDLNAFTFLDPEPARARAEAADVSLPFGGVPFGIKELDHFEGWPATEASLVFARPQGHLHEHDAQPDRRARRREPGRADVRLASSAASTSASTKLHGTPTTRGGTAHGRRLVRRQRRRRWPAGSCRSRPAATAAARSASRPASTASSG